MPLPSMKITLPLSRTVHPQNCSPSRGLGVSQGLCSHSASPVRQNLASSKIARSVTIVKRVLGTGDRSAGSGGMEGFLRSRDYKPLSAKAAILTGGGGEGVGSTWL